jgi:multidrug efflux pump subunit AcrA (membrane-fusion protein)
MKKILFGGLLIFTACNSHKLVTDASGVFESDEVIVSSEQNGKLLSFPVQEGDTLARNAIVGQIDMSNTILQKQQVQASIAALREKTTNPHPQTELIKRQLAVQEVQLAQQLRERSRTENLLKADAATQKQLDDINSMIDQLQKQIEVSKQQIALDESNIATGNRSVLSEQAPLEKSADRQPHQRNGADQVCFAGRDDDHGQGPVQDRQRRYGHAARLCYRKPAHAGEAWADCKGLFRRREGSISGIPGAGVLDLG